MARGDMRLRWQADVRAELRHGAEMALDLDPTYHSGRSTVRCIMSHNVIHMQDWVQFPSFKL